MPFLTENSDKIANVYGGGFQTIVSDDLLISLDCSQIVAQKQK